MVRKNMKTRALDLHTETYVNVFKNTPLHDFLTPSLSILFAENLFIAVT